MGLTVGVDVGGTKVAAGVVDEQGQVLARVRRATSAQVPGAAEQVITEAVRELGKAFPIEAVGIGAAGLVDQTRSVVRFAPNLGWREQPLRAQLERATGLPVVVENDANAAAWGEHRFGGGRASGDVVLITVGTGLGGGIVLNGRLLRGAFGIAGEVGHVRLVPGGRVCGCGNHGCWEQYTSGSALIREARELAATSPGRTARLLELAGGDPSAITGDLVTRVAREGDPAAVALLAEVGKWLGEGIADLACVLDPAVVVVGGGVSEAGDLLLEPARAAYAAQLSAGAYRPHLQIVAAELGNDAGLVGAADLARFP